MEIKMNMQIMKNFEKGKIEREVVYIYIFGINLILIF